MSSIPTRPDGPCHASRLAVAGCLSLAAPLALAGPGTQYPTTSWGLDRIDQRTPPLDGQICYDDPALGAGTDLYVVGAGVDIVHIDFGGRATWAWSFDGLFPTTDDQTNIASLAGGTEWGVGKQASVHSVRVGDGCTIADADLIAGLTWIRGNHVPGARSVVLLPHLSCDPAVNTIIGGLITAGIAVVAPAGDEGTKLGDPACTPVVVPEVIVVGATDANDCRALFSNYGACVDLWAPGEAVRGARGPNADTFTLSGTRCAAAYVAGMAAVYMSATNPAPPPAAVQAALITTATPLAGCGCNGDPMGLLYTKTDPGGFVAPVCMPCVTCPDIDGNGVVDFADVLALFGQWGPCPVCP